MVKLADCTALTVSVSVGDVTPARRVLLDGLAGWIAERLAGARQQLLVGLGCRCGALARQMLRVALLAELHQFGADGSLADIDSGPTLFLF